MRHLYLLLSLMLAAAASTAALAQATQLTPPGIKWGGSGVNTPAPIQQVGYDSGSGQPCIVGSTVTCVIPVTLTPISATPQSGAVQLTPPGLKWGSQTGVVPAPFQQIGYDSSSGQPCIIGYSSTCAVPIAGSTPIGPTTPTTFTAGSVIYSNGTTLAQDNPNFIYQSGAHQISLGNNSSGRTAVFGLTDGFNTFVRNTGGGEDLLADKWRHANGPRRFRSARCPKHHPPRHALHRRLGCRLARGVRYFHR